MSDDDLSNETSLVLRCDRRGRVQRTAAQRAELLAEYDRSGLSGPAFARVAGLSYPTLASWLQKRRQAWDAARTASAVSAVATAACFVPVEAAPPRAVSAAAAQDMDRLEVRLPCGASLAVVGAAQARLAGLLLRELNGGGATC